MLAQRILDDMKAAMKGGDKARLGVIRLLRADIKRIEVDERIELDDDRILLVLDKMVKQRRDSIRQFEDANRQELADQEKFEVGVLQEYLPTALTDDEIKQMIDAAVSETGASSMRDMGKVMGLLKPQMQGRADMGAVSGLIKRTLTA